MAMARRLVSLILAADVPFNNPKHLWKFDKGDEVKIVALSRDNNYNGKTATVVCQDNAQKNLEGEQDPYLRSRITRYFVKIDGIERVACLAAQNLRHKDDRKHRMMKELCEEEQRALKTSLTSLVRTFLISFVLVFVLPMFCLCVIMRCGFYIARETIPQWISPSILRANAAV
uniref:Uncharacterized protein n=1 Tax=Lotharella oceanica TaxID=641309 RepID=A0A7S2TZF5_9EUKA|mmetsp:Transcript_36846/g.68022  ORF Transcript_36846/g.68022 Transcript_36846/m.68022 type:complete len:173 (+) Transcript_36846:44-562(+)